MTLHGVAARTPDGRTLFDNLNLTFDAERTGIVGRNGAGKTTLLRLVAGLAEPSEGAVARSARIGWLDQGGDIEPDQTIAEALGAADALAQLNRIVAGEGSAEDFDAADWSLESRLAESLAQVGLEGLAMQRPISTLSGGEHTRLRLAALLLQQPDLLVLDEPTNHLDAEGRQAVIALLSRWRGGAVVAGHDRALLRGMDRIIELSDLGAAIYGGGYDLYAERKAAERAAAEQALETAERDLAQASRERQKAVEKKARRDRAGRAYAMKDIEPRILLGAMAERAEHTAARLNHLADRRGRDAEEALAQAREGVERLRTLSVALPPTGLSVGKTVLALEDVEWTAPDGRRIVGPISLRLTGPERLAISGANGAGKSTLLRLITGDLAPTAGRVDRPVTAALLDQEVSILSPGETILDAWRRLNPDGSLNDAQAALARFLFRNTAAHQTVGTLSGGERLRAGLACVMTGVAPPQLLVLDEPTNHLDLDAIAAVEASLADYDGALIVVSHDADFIAALNPTRTLAL